MGDSPLSPCSPTLLHLLTCSLFSCPSKSCYTTLLSLKRPVPPPQVLTAPLTLQAGYQLRASHLRFPLPGRLFPRDASSLSLLPELRYCPPTLFKAAAPQLFPSPHTLPCFVLFHCVYHHLTFSIFCLLVHCLFCARSSLGRGLCECGSLTVLPA